MSISLAQNNLIRHAGRTRARRCAVEVRHVAIGIWERSANDLIHRSRSQRSAGRGSAGQVEIAPTSDRVCTVTTSVDNSSLSTVSAMTRPPTWFTGAIANRGIVNTTDVSGCSINYLTWGDANKPCLILLHGGAAHAHWWSFIAPQFAQRHFVIAPDLAGHGDSGWRDSYTMERWSDDVMAVVEHAGAQAMPIVVGHSMGGHVALAMGARYGARLAGAIIIDTPVRAPDPESEEGQRGRMFKNPKVYPDLQTASEHFFLMPPQPCENGYIVDHIARHSLTQTDEGWTWKFDRRVFAPDRYMENDYLEAVTCRMALMHGQLSDLVTPEVQEHMENLTGRAVPMIEIPQAYHHVPLDQPLALVAAVRAILADWQHSVDKKQLRSLTD